MIGICDLTHTATGSYATNLMPYPIASIKSYLMHFSEFKNDFEVKIFKDPNKFIEWYLSNKPKIIGFSNYVWNKELSCELAREIKSKDPDTLIIFGGPNFPLDDPSREKWLKQHTEVDLYIIGEAEESFTKIIDIWHKTRDLNKIKTTDVIGCFAIVNDKLFKSSEFSPRIPKLESIPSPYL